MKDFTRRWIIASRPWTFTASIMPITLGSVLPYLAREQGLHGFKFGLYLLTALGGVFLQAAANFFNTYGDYVSGVDTAASAFSCPQIFTGIMKPESLKFAGFIMVALSVVIGATLSVLCGWSIFLFCVVGFAGAFYYTMGWFPYKYLGLGLPAVFFLMGPIMVVPSYYIQSGILSAYPAWASMPIAFLTAAIMHANDLRDIEYDRRAGIRTAALFLGLERSLLFYATLCFSAFFSSFLLVFIGFFPSTTLMSWALIPFLWIKVRRLVSLRQQEEIRRLVVWTAAFHLWFSVLFILGIIIFLIV